MLTDFTICALLYGDYPALVRRWARSLSRLAWRGASIRLAGNQMSGAAIAELARWMSPSEILALADYELTSENKLKYPVMRRMFRTPPVITPYIMWFDDDSYITDDAPDSWFEQVAAVMANNDLIGAPYLWKLIGAQGAWVRRQWWYAARPLIKDDHTAHFFTGGWWVIRTEAMLSLDWPPEEAEHNGWDVMLGLAAQQQGLRTAPFSTGVAINASESGKNSSAPRRGYRQPPVGCDFRE